MLQPGTRPGGRDSGRSSSTSFASHGMGSPQAFFLSTDARRPPLISISGERSFLDSRSLWFS